MNAIVDLSRAIRVESIVRMRWCDIYPGEFSRLRLYLTMRP